MKRALSGGKSKGEPPKKGVSEFLYKLYHILEDPEYQSILNWTSEGNAFQIKNITKLCEEILSSHFRHKNYASFIRQLNIYGFKKLPQSSKRNCYFHPLFRRHDKESLREICRNPIKGRMPPMDKTVRLHEVSKATKKLNKRLKHLEKTFEGFKERIDPESTPRRSARVMEKTMATLMPMMKADSNRENISTEQSSLAAKLLLVPEEKTGCAQELVKETQVEKKVTADGIPEQPKKKIRITIAYDDNDLAVARFRTRGWKQGKGGSVIMHISGIEHVPENNRCEAEAVDGMTL